MISHDVVFTNSTVPLQMYTIMVSAMRFIMLVVFCKLSSKTKTVGAFPRVKGVRDGIKIFVH